MLVDAAVHALSLVAERLESWGPTPWTGAVLDPPTMHLRVSELGPDLYEGLAGLAVSLSAVASAADSARFEHLAHEAIRRLRAQLDDGALGRHDLGLAGLGGIAWASHRLWCLLESDDAGACLKQACEALVGAVARCERALHVDLIGGEAGALLATLTLIEAEVIAGDHLERTGRRLVDLLLAASVEAPEGRTWPIFDGDHIVGLGHGTSGIVLALDRARRLGHRRDEIDAVIAAALAFEDAAFLPEVGNWRDERYDSAVVPWNCWCYGAAGTRYVRHHLGRPSPPGCVDPVDGDTEPVDQLCCGRAGRLLLARATGHPGARELAEAMAGRLLAGIPAVGTDDTTAVRADGSGATAPDLGAQQRSTSLFLGVTGIAYALVAQRQTDPAAVLTLG